MKKTYKSPVVDLAVLNTQDIITSSAIIADVADDVVSDIFGA